MPVQRVEMAHAVQQREDRGLRPDRRREALDRAVEVIGLAAQEHEVVGRREILGLHEDRVGDVDVPVWAADHQPGLPELRGAPGPDQEGYVTAGFGQPSPKIAANRTGPDDENTHDPPRYDRRRPRERNVHMRLSVGVVLPLGQA